MRELALFSLGIDSKLRGCDLACACSPGDALGLGPKRPPRAAIRSRKPSESEVLVEPNKLITARGGKVALYMTHAYGGDITPEHIMSLDMSGKLGEAQTAFV